jgi:serine/threonine-protein kinase HipA
MVQARKLVIFAHLDEGFAPAGKLTLTEENATVSASEFAYDLKYLEHPEAFEVDPVSLPLAGKVGVRARKVLPAGGLKLFGGIRDAAPDAWGRRVIDAKLRAPPDCLPESAYLLEAGSNRVGALDVRTGLHAATRLECGTIDELHTLLEAADCIDAGRPVAAGQEAIFDAGAALGGARPKASVRDGDKNLWLAKFPSAGEELKVQEIEEATLRLAAQCGLRVPETRLLDVGGQPVMLIRRFDRYWEKAGGGRIEKRRHFVSGLTMLGCDEIEARNKSYGELAQAIDRYCHPSSARDDKRELFARMVYNIFVSNDDDHLRNHGFLWDPALKGWRLSPLYDVVPHPAVGTERFQVLGVGRDGRLATLDNAMSEHALFSLSETEAAMLIARVWDKVREWRMHFAACGASAQSIAQAESAFRHIDAISTARLRALLP